VFFGLGQGADNNLAVLIDIGIIFFIAVLAFQLVTLPVEFNASRRAMKILTVDGFLSGEDEVNGARAVLRAAAMTYVAAVAVSIMQLVRLLLLSQRRR